jgi:hypothetical protein
MTIVHRLRRKALTLPPSDFRDGVLADLEALTMTIPTSFAIVRITGVQ